MAADRSEAKASSFSCQKNKVELRSDYDQETTQRNTDNQHNIG